MADVGAMTLPEARQQLVGLALSNPGLVMVALIDQLFGLSDVNGMPCQVDHGDYKLRICLGVIAKAMAAGARVADAWPVVYDPSRVPAAVAALLRPDTCPHCRAGAHAREVEPVCHHGLLFGVTEGVG